MDLAKTLLKAVDNEYAAMASDGIQAGDHAGVIDTGSYALNALLTGSVFGGVPTNRIICFAGEESTGKTFFTLAVVNNFLRDNPEGFVMFFESEGAISKSMMEERGIDPKRVVIIPVVTAEQFKNNCSQMVDQYLALPKKDQKPILCCLDSLGMLSTNKELNDSVDGKDVRDMTRSQVLKAAFRVLTLKLSRAQIPMIVTNHVYQVIGQMYAGKEMGGGSGAKYAASTIIQLTKAQAKGKDAGGKSSDEDRIGSIISCTATKSRMTIEKTKVKTLLTHAGGLDRYFGLMEIAKDAGLFQKDGNRWLNTLTGETNWQKDILNPNSAHLHFTHEFLIELDKFIEKTFCYGSHLSGDDVDAIDDLELNEIDETEGEIE